mgnify:CR=1 FL=1
MLYAVTDRAWLNGETLYEQVEKALKGGATFVQLREKKLDEEHFLEEAKELQKLYRYLVGKGYNYNDVKSAVRQYSHDTDMSL